MTPAAAIYEKLKADPRISDITTSHWIGAADPGDSAFTVIQFSEATAYRSHDLMRDTSATITVNACAAEYEVAWELAEAVRNALWGAADVANAKYVFGPISFESLGEAILGGQGQQTIFILPQVFTCTLRRL